MRPKFQRFRLTFWPSMTLGLNTPCTNEVVSFQNNASGLSSARWEARHRGARLHQYAEVLHERQIKCRWRYAQHWLPHDVKHRELNTAMSRIETLRSLGSEPEAVPAHNK